MSDLATLKDVLNNPEAGDVYGALDRAIIRIEALEAENKRLHKYLRMDEPETLARIEALEAENERLRARIADLDPNQRIRKFVGDPAETVTLTARAALPHP